MTPVAPSLPRSQIFCLMPFATAYARDVARGLADYAATVSMVITAGTDDYLPDLWQRLSGFGFVVMQEPATDINVNERTRAEAEKKIPNLAINVAESAALTTANPTASFWAPDNHHIGVVAAHHLLAWFGFVGGAQRSFSNWAGTTAGFVETAEAHDRSVIDIPSTDLEPLRHWLRAQSSATAVYATNDHLADRLRLAALHENSFEQPGLAILGTGNDRWLCELNRPYLSSIDLNGYLIGQHVAAHLHRQLPHHRQGRTVDPCHEILTAAEIIERDTTTPLLGIESELVAHALEVIEAHAGQGLTAEQLAAEVGCSSRTLRDHFQERFGYSATDAIKHARLARVKAQLRTTTTNITELALDNGFSGSSRLSLAFRRAFDMSPSEYRQRYKTT